MVVVSTASPTHALVGAAGFAAAYVGSLYVWKRATSVSRNHPDTIKRRFLSVTVVCCLCPLALQLLFVSSTTSGPPLHAWLGLRQQGLFAACVLPLLLTMSLFLGPLVHSGVEWWLQFRQQGRIFSLLWHDLQEKPLISSRDYLVVCASLCFLRRCALSR